MDPTTNSIYLKSTILDILHQTWTEWSCWHLAPPCWPHWRKCRWRCPCGAPGRPPPTPPPSSPAHWTREIGCWSCSPAAWSFQQPDILCINIFFLNPHWNRSMYEVTPLSLGGNPRRKANDYLVKCWVDNETVVFVPINGAERRALHNAGQMNLKVDYVR